MREKGAESLSPPLTANLREQRGVGLRVSDCRESFRRIDKLADALDGEDMRIGIRRADAQQQPDRITLFMPKKQRAFLTS